MSDEPDRGTWIAAIERALKVAKGNGAKTHPRVAVIKKPAGCDPCSYPECGCAYPQDDPRRPDAMSDIVKRLRDEADVDVNEPLDRLLENAADEIERLREETRIFVLPGGERGVICGGRFDGWLCWRHPDGQFVTLEKLKTEAPRPFLFEEG